MTSSSDRMAALGHELKLLVDMVLENSAPWLESLEAAGHGGGSSHTSPDADDGKPHSDWCPWCLLVDLARRDTSELSAKAMAQTTQLVSLLRAVLADRFHPGEGVHLPTFGLGFGSDSGPGADEDSGGSDGADADAAEQTASADEPAQKPETDPEPEADAGPAGRHAFPGDALAAQSMDEPADDASTRGRHAMPEDEPVAEPGAEPVTDDGPPAWKPSPAPRPPVRRVQKIAVRKSWFD